MSYLAPSVKVQVDQLQVDMHVEKVAVAFPLGSVVDGGKSVQGVCKRRKIRLEGKLEVLDVLHGVFGVMVQRLVVQTVVLLSVENAPGRCREERHHNEQDGKNSPLHIPVIGRPETIFQISSWISSLGLSPSTTDISIALDRYFSIAAR